MRNKVLTLIIYFVYSCSTDEEVANNYSSYDDIKLYNQGMKHLKKQEFNEAIDIFTELKYNIPTLNGHLEGNY